MRPFVSYRDKVITLSWAGTLNRAWYHCRTCKHGLAPRDAELGVAGSPCPGPDRDERQGRGGRAVRGAASMLEDLAGVRLTSSAPSGPPRQRRRDAAQVATVA